MIDLVNEGKVGTIIVKDMSRLGRDYLRVGMYTDIIFPEKDIRFIAINDGVDSMNISGNDFTPIRNLFNEFHARDTAKKVKDSMALKGKSGNYLCTHPPYGYQKDPDNPKEWLVDEDAAKVVRRVYQLCIAGKGVSQIARSLRQDRILTPSWHCHEKGVRIGRQLCQDRYGWSSAAVVGILEKPEYVGDMVNFKTYRKNYKTHRKLDNPKEKWLVFEDAHEPIVERAVWEKVQELRKNKRRYTKVGKTSMFSGILRCADCGAKLYFIASRVVTSNQDHFVCSNYKSNTGTCSGHFIREEVLKHMVFKHLHRVLKYVQQFEAAFVRSKYEQSFEDRQVELVELKRNIVKANNRIEELNRLFKRMYEDHVAGNLSAERFQMLTTDCDAEQRQLKLDLTRMAADVARGEEVTADFQKFLTAVRKHTDVKELTPTVLNELISKIVIHAPDYSTGKRTQEIDIYYNSVGIINIPTEAEMEALEAEYKAQKQADQSRRQKPSICA